MLLHKIFVKGYPLHKAVIDDAALVGVEGSRLDHNDLVTILIISAFFELTRSMETLKLITHPLIFQILKVLRLE